MSGEILQPNTVVDAHVHIYPPEWVASKAALLERDRYFGLLFRGPRGHMATAEDLIASMDAAGIGVSVAVGFGWDDQGLCREQNGYIANACRRYPDRLIGLATVSPCRPGATAEVSRALASGLAGIGELMPDGPGYSVDDASVLDPLLDLAEDAGVPVLMHVSEPVGHVYPGKGTVTPAQIVALAERWPDVTLICGHLGGGLPFYELMPEVRRVLARVYYDTAAWPLLYRDDVFRAISAAAPGKLLFATDFPLIPQAGLVERVTGVGLSAEAQRAILGATALDLFGGGEERC